MSTSAWTLRAIESLRNAGSWTGRIHIHKLLYLADRIAGAQQPFEFELYQFGPYSFDLDFSIRDLGVCGLVMKQYLQDGYGPSYSTEPHWQDSVLDDIPAEQINLLKTVADRISRFNSQSLELIATCHWVENELDVNGEEEVVETVQKIKPRYQSDQIREQLRELRRLEQQLQPA